QVLPPTERRASPAARAVVPSPPRAGARPKRADATQTILRGRRFRLRPHVSTEDARDERERLTMAPDSGKIMFLFCSHRRDTRTGGPTALWPPGACDGKAHALRYDVRTSF